MQSITIEAESLLSTVSGLLGLYESCFSKGLDPREAGLPPLPDPRIVLFRGRLTRNGEVVATASLQRQVDKDTAWEQAERDLWERLEAMAQSVAGIVPDAPPQAPEEPLLREQEEAAEESPAPSGDLPVAAAVKVPPILMQSIQELAGHRGVPVPSFSSVKEAKEFYKELAKAA